MCVSVTKMAVHRYLGNMLLTSGEDLVLWSEPPSLPSINEEEELGGGDWRETKWIQTWKEALPQPPILIKFSGDSTMFATCGKVFAFISF